MNFYLKKDKLVLGERGTLFTFLEAGLYEVVRQFDKDRVIVRVNHGKPKQITLLKIQDGEFSHD